MSIHFDCQITLSIWIVSKGTEIRCSSYYLLSSHFHRLYCLPLRTIPIKRRKSNHSSMNRMRDVFVVMRIQSINISTGRAARMSPTGCARTGLYQETGFMLQITVVLPVQTVIRQIMIPFRIPVSSGWKVSSTV